MYSCIVGCRGNPGPDILELWKLSLKCFKSGIEAFDSVDDTVNMALVHSNRLLHVFTVLETSYSAFAKIFSLVSGFLVKNDSM